MTETTIRPARWKVAVAWIVAALPPMFAFSVMPEVQPSSGDIVVSAMISITAAAYAYFASGRYLRLRPEAFETKERFQPGHYTLWSDVDKVGLATFRRSGRSGLTYDYLVGIKLRDEAVGALSEEYRQNRAACGYDLLLEPNYGLGIDRLIDLLKEKKREAETG